MTTTKAILKDLGISEEQALREFALLSASQKLAEFVQEDQYFRKKYELDFAEFEKKIKSSDQEIFIEEDDYLAWKFVHESIIHWRSKVQTLHHSQ